MMPNKLVEDEYLGDGVYASFDGCHIVLDLRGQEANMRIALEPQVLAALDRYRQRVAAELDAESKGGE